MLPRPRSIAAAAAVVVAACGEPPADDLGSSFELLSIDPRTDALLFLNEDIRLTFSDVLDPASVTEAALTLVDTETGRAARGRWIVDGRVLRFAPRGVKSAALTDGGYGPGSTLRLEVGGFPRVSALRSRDGERLSTPLAVDFDVVPTTAERTFIDPSPDYTERLYLRLADRGSPESAPLDYDEPLVVACDEPLDPRTLDPSEFEIVRVAAPAGRPPFGSPEIEDRVPVRSLVLLQNEVGEEPGAAALLRVVPARPLRIDRSTGPFEYELRYRDPAAEPRLRDFSGGAPSREPVRFLAAHFDQSPSEDAASYAFDFVDRDDFAPLADRGADGTAYWGESGRVEVRYPRAAGDGGEGRVTLVGGAFVANDLHATRLTVPGGVEVEVDGRGLVVLRSQGRIEIAGALRRRLPSDLEPLPMWDPVEVRQYVRRRPPEALSAWLEGARTSDAPWTVLVAGGDIVVEGEIDVDTPLLLVAGGRIRGRGLPRAASGQLWILGQGGFDVSAQAASGGRANPAPPLAIDPPFVNPIREPLVFVAYSSPAPKTDAPRLWGRPQIVSVDGQHGSARVQFVDAALPRAAGTTGVWEYDAGQAVRHPEPMGVIDGRLPGAEAGARVRLRIELTVEPAPGAPWDPPFLDRVLLSWTQDPLR